MQSFLRLFRLSIGLGLQLYDILGLVTLLLPVLLFDFEVLSCELLRDIDGFGSLHLLGV